MWKGRRNICERDVVLGILLGLGLELVGEGFFHTLEENWLEESWLWSARAESVSGLG